MATSRVKLNGGVPKPGDCVVRELDGRTSARLRRQFVRAARHVNR
jgi:hypothetical protein